MIYTVPIYLVKYNPGSGRRRYRGRPLLGDGPVADHERLNRVMEGLSRDLTRRLNDLSRAMRHEELARWGYCPELTTRKLKATFHLKKSTARCRFLLVVIPTLDRRLVFTPSLPDLWFEVHRGESIESRAVEVLEEHFRMMEKEEEDFNPESISLDGEAQVTTIDISVTSTQKPPEPADNMFAIGPTEAPSGSEELQRVGRQLDARYPDELHRAVLRDCEVDALTSRLDRRPKQPVLLLGPPRVGKTTIVHEHVYRKASKRKTADTGKRNVWLLSPQRLISGMSYVGQWESRLLAILDHVRKYRHTLYFDDLLGLFRAGVTCQSNLNVANVLRPYLERGDIAVVAEATPQTFRVLQEQDRAFADMFHVIRVDEPSEQDNLQILISVVQQLEDANNCRFDVSVLPTVIDLQRRYTNQAVFPGKAADLVRQLALQHNGMTIQRGHVLEAFHQRSGLSMSFFDAYQKLEREEVVSGLRKMVIGQQQAVDAMADVVARAKARVNDPGKPLASLLFLGPTGVGKTQCAKALASYLFGHADRLIRFDMNEFVAPGSAVRLVGDFSQPEGLLTDAVRRQPFCVILLDEIEKADPGVFDLLLQALGEGRLTDALGRTADLTNTIIILTSNLGTQQAGRHMGFRRSSEEAAEAYRHAAQLFFRPEFFNRLDRVVPFATLTADELRSICRMVLDAYLSREGLIRRRSVLTTDEAFVDFLIEAGHKPEFGARALKRTVENALTRPLSAQLAGIAPDDPMVVTLRASADGTDINAQALTHAAQQPMASYATDPTTIPAFLNRIHDTLRDMRKHLDCLRPPGGVFTGDLEPEHHEYIYRLEELQDLEAHIEEIEKRFDRPKRAGSMVPESRPGRRPKAIVRQHFDRVKVRRLWQEVFAAEDVHEYVRELMAATPAAASEAQLVGELDCLTNKIALAYLREQQPLAQRNELVAIRFRGPVEAHPFPEHMHFLLYTKFDQSMQVSRDPGEGSVLVAPALYMPLLRSEAGTHLCMDRDGRIAPFRLVTAPVSPDWNRQPDPYDALRTSLDRVEEAPEYPPVIRLYVGIDEGFGNVIDLRTGWGITSGWDVYGAMVYQLPRPETLRE